MINFILFLIGKAYDKLYSKLGTKEGKKDISKLAKRREMKVSKQEHIKL